MARIRTVKPEVAQHEVLYQLEQELQINVRFAWVMLPSQCDREGRFKWRPSPLKLGCLPYDQIDFSRVLDAWLTRGMLVKYRVGDVWYGWIPTWKKHQAVNNREVASELPGLDCADEAIDYRYQEDADASTTREGRVKDATQQDNRRDPDATRGEGKGKEGKGREGERNDASPDLHASDGLLTDPITLEQARALQSAYPRGTYNQTDWILVERLVNQHIADGIAYDRILASFERYAAQCDATGSTGRQFVRSPVKHCDREHPLFDEPFPLPRTKAESQQDANLDAGRRWLAEQEARDAIG